MGLPIWVGAEDHEYVQMGGAAVSTTVGTFRTSNSRCSLACGDGEFYEAIKPYAESEFWFSACAFGALSSGGVDGAKMLVFLDDGLVERIRVVSNESSTFRVERVNAAGVATKIGNTFFWPVSTGSGILDKLDVHIVYDTVGSIDIYVNGIYVFAFAGDATSDGQTILARHRVGNMGRFNTVYWSETWIDQDDTRSRSLIGFDMVANGHANTFDIGSPSVSNINEIVLDDGTLNGASTAGLIDQYTNGAVPSGTKDVIALVVSARPQRGASGPTKLALGVRTNGTDYWGSDQLLDLAWDNVQEIFGTNPDTGIPWLKSEIGAAVGFNVGTKSAA
jgi:hypothetical protein